MQDLIHDLQYRTWVAGVCMHLNFALVQYQYGRWLILDLSNENKLQIPAAPATGNEKGSSLLQPRSLEEQQSIGTLKSCQSKCNHSEQEVRSHSISLIENTKIEWNTNDNHIKAGGGE